MRVPKIKKYNKEITKELLELGPLDLTRKFYNMSDEKDLDRFIKDVEKLCRQSLEYKELISYLHMKLGMDFCSYFHHVSKREFGKKIKVEIHHEPFTLYDVASIILKRRMDEDESLDLFDVANEVMEEHYKGHVGLLPLSVTVHELVHSGQLFIPLQFIDEGFNLFYNKYQKTIDSMSGLREMLEAKVRLSKQFAEDPKEFMSVLQKKYIYVVNEDYVSTPEPIE